MKYGTFLLAIDQGTTNSRAIIFDKAGNMLAQHQLPLAQQYPQDGWVEQDPLEMVSHTVSCCRAVLEQASLTANSIAAIGITNQRETTIVWDKQTGQPIYPAIVWQDRRTAPLCKQLSGIPAEKRGNSLNVSMLRTNQVCAGTKRGESRFSPLGSPHRVRSAGIAEQLSSKASLFFDKTGLLLDPYFSGTKLCWLLDNVPGARERAARGELLFGTVDCFLLWNLTRGQSHATDATNASRTLLFNIHTQQWDKEILALLDIPPAMLPTVLDNTAHFGDLHEDFLGSKIMIAGMAGDQQAATIGQACFTRGMAKATYGTGAFMLLNTGSDVIRSQHRLLSTVLYRMNGKVTYGLEGSIFSAGSTVKWLRDKLHFLQTAAESEVLARRVESTEGVYFIPAFTGLGAPYWNPDVRAAFTGITQAVRPEHLVRAGLESVAYQTRDLLYAMTQDSGFDIASLRVDGGMAANAWLLQFLSDMLNVDVHRPACIETTALGAAWLAGLQVGLFNSLEDIAACSHLNAKFTPSMSNDKREKLYAGWKKACDRILWK